MILQYLDHDSLSVYENITMNELSEIDPRKSRVPKLANHALKPKSNRKNPTLIGLILRMIRKTIVFLMLPLLRVSSHPMKVYNSYKNVGTK